MNRLFFLFIAIYFQLVVIGQYKYPSVSGAKAEAFSSETGLPLLVILNDSETLSLEKFPSWMQDNFMDDKNSSFAVYASEKDQLGLTHTRFQEYYKGTKIENTMIVTHGNGSFISSFNGDWYKNITLSNVISLSEQQALNFALAKVDAKKYRWENSAEEEHMKSVLKNPQFSYKPTGEVVVLPIIDKLSKAIIYSYAYKFNIYAETPLYRANIYVDAASGKVIKEQNLLCTIDVAGSAATKYSGTQAITIDNYSGAYRLREAGRGNGIETYNLNNGTNYAAVTDFTNTTNSWTSTGYDQAATDAHWGAEKTYDYYMQTFNRNSIDNAGQPLLSYVHYDIDLANAFWDGQRMTYGDGDLNQGYNIMTALDICGHEITHGLVQNTAQLNGPEADALNEAFADIFGTAIEWYGRPSQHDWLVGADVSTAGAGLRNMSNPNQYQQPDTYHGTYWDQNDESHNNNGPCIYWYYLLSVGGSGTNDNSQSYNVSSITMTKASAIAYRALSVYMTPGTTYANVRAYTIQAAKDLYGDCSNECIQTTNAWYAVGVGVPYNANAIVPNFFANNVNPCITQLPVNFTNTSENAVSYTWDFGDGSTSTLTNPSHTYLNSGSYTVKLVAKGCVANNKDSIIKTSYITINSSNSCGNIMSSPTRTYSACYGTLSDNGGANNYSSNSTYKSTIVAGTGSSITLNFSSFEMEYHYDSLIIYQGYGTTGPVLGSYTGYNLPNNGNHIVINQNVITIVQVSDGALSYSGFKLAWQCSISAVNGVADLDNSLDNVLIYPNPATQNIVLSNLTAIHLLELINTLGQVVYTEIITPDTYEKAVNISSLSTGVYTAKLYMNNGNTISKKIVKH